MRGEPDPLDVAARSVLLDALEALGPPARRDRVVGAQAIYVHTGAIEFEVAEYTTDADVCIDPRLLTESPELESALISAASPTATGHSMSPISVSVRVRCAPGLGHSIRLLPRAPVTTVNSSLEIPVTS